MTPWPRIASDALDGWADALAAERRAKRWLLVHQWVLIPVAFVAGWVVRSFL